MSETSALKALEPIKIPSVADAVFEELHQQILSLELAPGTRMSEVEVAKAFGVSRQPVRDAFYRLSQLGFLLIRPQRATVITKISEVAVLRARFVRTSLEIACLRAAAEVVTEDDIKDLQQLIDEQQAAISANERQLFHRLDDDFHRLICDISGHDYVWALIREQKAHMDRVRFLSLASGAQAAHDDHVGIINALREGSGERAEARLKTHLSRIETILGKIRAENPEHFEE
ncbi:GntR family transcriptional regulator [Roseibium marinum]|uniref:DNA-binding GntR family transcriptional regulator n=1 Tax=Roseibium marinum TaxID=281252 RepID=A0A2S3UJL5_9HYPH|nr:GntR family transcriptional regulator [Roseibium marinum]POF27855.1 DNA-binding GntR family transcriptional regulator [Roseibium marinum]